MPATRPRAAFEPIRPDFDLDNLVENTPNFEYVPRISCKTVEIQGLAAFEKLVTLHVIVGGRPLVIDGFEERLDPWTFTPKWLAANCGEKVENARNISAQTNLPLTLGHYLKNMSILTNQFFEGECAYREKKRQRMYLKDIDCPAVWWDKVKEHIPVQLAYLNDSTGDVGGPGSVPDGNAPGRRLGRGIARAGDLMSSLPPDMRAENLMCYIGHEGTYTPAHREMCASLGHNIMVEASTTVNEDGQVEKPGSSIWFMTESKDRHLVSEYFLSVLGHDIEVENHFAQVAAWKKAPFPVFVVDQRPGDLILIPPLAPHQVWNRGTRTMKVAWNRTTVETLEMAIHEALPRSRIVCREEMYKNKAIIYYSLQKYASLLGLAQQHASHLPPEQGHHMLYASGSKIRQLTKDFKRLFELFKQIMLSEMFSPSDRDHSCETYIPFDSNITCAYCRGNIFNRFLTCPASACKERLGHNEQDAEGDPYDVCMDCYAMGRSCECTSGYKWVEQFRWKELTVRYDGWRQLIISLDGGQITPKTPLTLVEERKRLGKKSLAEICKEQLKRRPFKDIQKSIEPKEDDSEEEEVVVDDNGMVKKVKKKKSKSWEKHNQPCHVCCKRHPTWKMAHCTTCEKWWCYGSLFRGWDKMPQQIMEDADWTCPHCLNICFAGACRKDPRTTPYEPKGTLLGHDTKKVADVRSVEVLVDFSVSNLNWLKGDDPEVRTESARFKRVEAEARRNKEIADQIDDDEDDDVDETQVIMEGEQSMVDPALDDGHTRNFASINGSSHHTDADTALAHRLQMATSYQAPTAQMGSAPDGYVPVDYGNGSVYPVPGETSSYAYPGQERNSEDAEIEQQTRVKKRRRKTTGDVAEAEAEDISMTKGRSKKPRLTAAGFQSLDLADPAGDSAQAKTETLRQFEREKERKALEKAKKEGRFIRLTAALRGKKCIVKLSVPGQRLAQLLARQAARAAMGDDDADHDDVEDGDTQDAHDIDNDDGPDGLLLKSDIPVKKIKPSARENYDKAVEAGKIITGGTKKARIPVEKDDAYDYRERVRMPNGKRVTVNTTEHTAAAAKAKRRGPNREYEEVDIGSSEDELDDADDAQLNTSQAEPEHTSISQARTAKERRSLPGYLHARHEGDDSLPDELPDNFRLNQRSQAPAVRKPESRVYDANGAELQEHIVVAGKRPSVRPSREPVNDYNEDDIDAFIAQAANGDFMSEHTASATAPAITTSAGAPRARPGKRTTSGFTPANAPTEPMTISDDENSDDMDDIFQQAAHNHEFPASYDEQNRLAKIQAFDQFA